MDTLGNAKTLTRQHDVDWERHPANPMTIDAYKGDEGVRPRGTALYGLRPPEAPLELPYPLDEPIPRGDWHVVATSQLDEDGVMALHTALFPDPSTRPGLLVITPHKTHPPTMKVLSSLGVTGRRLAFLRLVVLAYGHRDAKYWITDQDDGFSHLPAAPDPRHAGITSYSYAFNQASMANLVVYQHQVDRKVWNAWYSELGHIYGGDEAYIASLPRRVIIQTAQPGAARHWGVPWGPCTVHYGSRVATLDPLATTYEYFEALLGTGLQDWLDHKRIDLTFDNHEICDAIGSFWPILWVEEVYWMRLNESGTRWGLDTSSAHPKIKRLIVGTDIMGIMMITMCAFPAGMLVGVLDTVFQDRTIDGSHVADYYRVRSGEMVSFKIRTKGRGRFGSLSADEALCRCDIDLVNGEDWNRPRRGDLHYMNRTIQRLPPFTSDLTMYETIPLTITTDKPSLPEVRRNLKMIGEGRGYSKLDYNKKSYRTPGPRYVYDVRHEGNAVPKWRPDELGWGLRDPTKISRQGYPDGEITDDVLDPDVLDLLLNQLTQLRAVQLPVGTRRIVVVAPYDQDQLTGWIRLLPENSYVIAYSEHTLQMSPDIGTFLHTPLWYGVGNLIQFSRLGAYVCRSWPVPVFMYNDGDTDKPISFRHFRWYTMGRHNLVTYEDNNLPVYPGQELSGTGDPTLEQDFLKYGACCSFLYGLDEVFLADMAIPLAINNETKIQYPKPRQWTMVEAKPYVPTWTRTEYRKIISNYRKWLPPDVFIWFAYGSTGDVRPISALAQTMGNHLPTVIVRLTSQSEAQLQLAKIESRQGWSIPQELWTYGSDPLFCPFRNAAPISIPAGRHTVTYSATQAPWLLKQQGSGFPKWLDSGLAVFIGGVEPDFRIGAFNQYGWVPRSADGTNYLTRRPPLLLREKWGYNIGSGVHVREPPQGAKELPPGDHLELARGFENVAVVGAGTAQTVACAGATAHSLSDAIDRDLIRPLTPNDVSPGRDPIWVFWHTRTTSFLPIGKRLKLYKEMVWTLPEIIRASLPLLLLRLVVTLPVVRLGSGRSLTESIIHGIVPHALPSTILAASITEIARRYGASSYDLAKHGLGFLWWHHFSFPARFKGWVPAPLLAFASLLGYLAANYYELREVPWPDSWPWYSADAHRRDFGDELYLRVTFARKGFLVVGLHLALYDPHRGELYQVNTRNNQLTLLGSFIRTKTDILGDGLFIPTGNKPNTLKDRRVISATYGPLFNCHLELVKRGVGVQVIGVGSFISALLFWGHLGYALIGLSLMWVFCLQWLFEPVQNLLDQVKSLK
nr:hypothetical protein [Rhizoctonia zeae hypovirus 1]